MLAHNLSGSWRFRFNFCGNRAPDDAKDSTSSYRNSHCGGSSTSCGTHPLPFLRKFFTLLLFAGDGTLRHQRAFLLVGCTALLHDFPGFVLSK
jgi:hypothetical protein